MKQNELFTIDVLTKSFLQKKPRGLDGHLSTIALKLTCEPVS